MRVAVLGPLEVLTDDSVPIPVPGETERLLLGVLAAGAPGVVDADRLSAAVPADTAESWRVHLERLRGALEPGLPERTSGQYVLRRGRGYVLAVGRSDIDALRFRTLTDRARAQLAAGDATEAARLLTTALALWRGRPYADWPDAAFAEEERRRLAEVRTDAENALGEARVLLAARPEPARRPASPLPTLTRPQGPVAPRARSDEAPVPPRARSAEAVQPPGRTEADPGVATDASGVEPEVAERSASPPPKSRGWSRAGVLAATLVGTLIVTGLAVRSQRQANQQATASGRASIEAAAHLLVDRSTMEVRLDVALLLATQAARMADTPKTREGLLAALTTYDRAERIVPTLGGPQGATLAGGGRILGFGVGSSVVAWTLGPSTQPRDVMAVPAEWGSWTLVSASPTKDEVMAAGESQGVPWLRMISVADGTSRLLLEGDAIGGTPVDGALSADGRRVLLLVARPVDDAQDVASRWQLIDVDVTSGAKRDTGIGGTVATPVEMLAADFATGARSFVVYDGVRRDQATFVDVSDGRQTTIRGRQRPSHNVAFRAFASGAAQLWADGTVSVIDRSGSTVQELENHGQQVLDVAVSPDGTWAATAGEGPQVFRWAVDPATGRWSDPEPLRGHGGTVVDVEVDAEGRRLFTVGLDNRVIVWAMRTSAGAASGLRPGDLEAWLDQACAIVGRDFLPREWQYYLPDRPWAPTCTDLL